MDASKIKLVVTNFRIFFFHIIIVICIETSTQEYTIFNNIMMLQANYILFLLLFRRAFIWPNLWYFSTFARFTRYVDRFADKNQSEAPHWSWIHLHLPLSIQRTFFECFWKYKICIHSNRYAFRLNFATLFNTHGKLWDVLLYILLLPLLLLLIAVFPKSTNFIYQKSRD